MARSVKRPAFDLDSGHDLMVGEFEPRVRLYADSVKPAWDSLSVSLSLPPSLNLSASLTKINKLKKMIKSIKNKTTVVIMVTDLKQKHEHNDEHMRHLNKQEETVLKKNTVEILEQKNTVCKIKYSLAGSGRRKLKRASVP